MKNNKLIPTRSLGYSLIEVMLALVILAAGVAGVYMMLKPAGINAGVQQEQKQLDSLVSGVQSAFGTTGGSYENISVASARGLNLTGVDFNGNTISSSLGDSITLRPATVRQAHDGFDAVYTGLDERKCVSYINAFSPQTYTILVGSAQTPVQATSGVNEGRLVSEDQIVQACNASAFKNSQGVVAFRFFSPSAQSSSVVENVCSCSPRTQERKLSCGTGQAGDIAQERTSTCSGGTGACPTEVWGSWATTSNTCAGGLTPVVTPPSTPGTDLCVPTTERRTQACPVGYNGSIVEERLSTCASPASNPVWGAWAVSDNSCVPNTGETYTCTPAIENRNIPCTAPLTGSISQLRSSTCSHPNATPTWGAWIEQSQNCQQACVAGQNCCQPQPDQFRDVSCPAGQYGLINERNSSFCASASAALAWNGWQANGGGCSICPGPVTETDIPNWDPRSAPCPAGFAGSHTWEAQQTRTRVRTYNCNPSPVVLPPPSYTLWSGWSDTGVIRNEVNTCVSTSCTIPAGTVRNWTVGGNTCNGPALPSPVTIASGTSRAWNDLIAPTTGTASFQCTNTVLAVTPNPGATCNVSGGGCGDWVSVVYALAPNWGNLDGESVFYDDGAGGGCDAVWGARYGGTSDRTAFNACEDSIPSRAPRVGASYELREYTGYGGGMENTFGYEAPAACDCTAPAPTTTPVTRPAAPATRNLACHDVHGGTAANWTGGITQSQSRTENGTTTTTWTCPGPTSSATTAWHGTYNLGSWVTTSDTCAPVSTPTCNAGNEATAIFNSKATTDGSDYPADIWMGSGANWSFVAANGVVCNASSEGKMMAVMQGGPVDVIEGTVFVCRSGAFVELWSQDYPGGWDNVSVTSQGAATMGIAAGYHATSTVIPNQWKPQSPISNMAGIMDWDDQPGTNKGADHFWMATFVCGGPALTCTWTNSTGNCPGCLGSGGGSDQMGVGVIFNNTAANSAYFGPPAWTSIDAGQRMGTGNGSPGGGGTLVDAGKTGRSRLVAANPSASDIANMNQARTLIMAYQCQPGDQWFWINGQFSGQASYCSCN